MFLKSIGQKALPYILLSDEIGEQQEHAVKQPLQRNRSGGPQHLHHVMVIVPVDDVHRRQDLPPDSRAGQRVCSLSLEEVRHEEHLGCKPEIQISECPGWPRNRPRGRQETQTIKKRKRKKRGPNQSFLAGGVGRVWLVVEVISSSNHCADRKLRH